MNNTLPAAFVASMCALLGAAEAEQLVQTLTATEPACAIRLNRAKWSASAPAAAAQPVPWCGDGYLLTRRPAFTFDPLLHAGAYYVQEPASMFLAAAIEALRATQPLLALDLCAAPGGKATLLRGALPAGSLLVANEPVGTRVGALVENLCKWGHADVVATQAQPAQFAALGGAFGLIVADVPCSGEGMFRKDAGAIAQWSTDAVARCAARQRQIIADVWPALAAGGYLIYSTCTFNRAECDDNVDWICRTLGAEAVALPHYGQPIVGRYDGAAAPAVAHFLPHRTMGEGFFLALLRKTGDAPPARTRRTALGRRPAEVPRAAKDWLQQSDDFAFRNEGEAVVAVRRTWLPTVQALEQALQVVMAGVAVGRIKGRTLRPAAALALSTALRRDAFAHVELNYAEAVPYLRGEALSLPAGTERGLLAATYRGLPLGWLNNVGARANNLYPAPWRIKSGHVPPEPHVL